MARGTRPKTAVRLAGPGRAVRRFAPLSTLAVLVLVVLFLVVLFPGGTSFSASAAGSATSSHGSATQGAATQARPDPALTMVAQSSWVKPGQSFDMTLAIGGSTARSQLGIALAAYTPPEGQSSFEETLAGNTGSESLLSDTPIVPVTSLPTDQDGDIRLNVGITAGDAQARSAALELNLSCQPLACNGVYPLRVQLMDTAEGSEIGSLTTDIVLVESNVSSKLRVSLVVPVGASPSGTTSSNEPEAPSGSKLSRVAALVNELEASPAAVTVYPQPQTVQALAAGSPAARNVAEGIVSISDNASAQVLDAPYVWVNPASLVDSGLSSELPRQIRRGTAVLGAVEVQTSGSVATIDDGLDTQTLASLAASGVGQVIVPSDHLAAVSGRFAGPSVQTFDLDIGHGHTIEAAQTDPSLQSELSDAQGSGPVLSAHQLLADLALIAFEEPDSSWNRGIVLAPGLNWSPLPEFLTTFLSGLAAIPVLDPVTASSFFTQVTKGDDGGNPNNGDGWPKTRQLASGAGPVSAFPASALGTARTTLGALESVVKNGPVDLTALGDSLLGAESVLLTFQQQVAALSDLDAIVKRRAQVVSLTAYHTIRITSQTATIPITLVRRVPYPVTVVIHLSSDKLGFLHRSNPQIVHMTSRLQSVNIDVFARTAGDFPVVVSIRSPSGGLLITSATFTVRSLSTSVVAIVLSACAAAVLLVWWGRTFFTKRRSRRGAAARGAHSAHHGDTSHPDETHGDETPATSNIASTET